MCFGHVFFDVGHTDVSINSCDILVNRNSLEFLVGKQAVKHHSRCINFSPIIFQ